MVFLVGSERERFKALNKSLRLQNRLGRKLAPKLKREFKQAGERAAKEFLKAGRRPSNRREHFFNLVDILQEHYWLVGREVNKRVAKEFEKSLLYKHESKGLIDSFEFLLSAFVGNRADTQAEIMGATTNNQLEKVIERGVRNNATTEEIASDITRTISAFSSARAAAASVTETQHSSMWTINQTGLLANEELGLSLKKEWVTNIDGRERKWHRRVDGQRRNMDMPFDVPNSKGDNKKMQHPSDPAGGADNVINCRCTEIYIEETKGLILHSNKIHNH